MKKRREILKHTQQNFPSIRMEEKYQNTKFYEEKDIKKLKQTLLNYTCYEDTQSKNYHCTKCKHWIRIYYEDIEFNEKLCYECMIKKVFEGI